MPDQRGFTLLELLVAMTILSLVALIMMGGLKFGARAWERVQTTSDETDSIDVVESLLRRQLAAAYPLWQDGSGPGQAHVVFEGTSGSVTFLAPPPTQLGPGPNQQFDLHLAPNGDLDLDWQPGLSASSPTHATLLHHIASIDLSYFGPLAGSRVPQWSASWVNRTHLPQLIRVRVSFPADDRRVWPELVVRPEIMVDVRCIYDPISRDCRGRPE